MIEKKQNILKTKKEKKMNTGILFGEFHSSEGPINNARVTVFSMRGDIKHKVMLILFAPEKFETALNSPIFF
jgi:hypothetical protein